MSLIDFYLLFRYMSMEKQRLEAEVKTLTEELIETNRGVLALVQEIERFNESLLKNDLEKTTFLENLKKTNKEQMERIKAQEKALIQADKMASLGQLVAGVAHEINNPTTYIKANIELLQKYWVIVRRSLDDCREEQFQRMKQDVDEVLKSMYKGTERITDIVSGLKFFSRQETVEFKEVNLSECIEDAYKLTKNELIRNMITFRRHFGQEHFFIHGSKQQMEQVFVNLILNSINAIGKRKQHSGIIEFYVSLPDPENICVQVKDDGCGIGEKDLEMVFNPFFTTHVDDGGTGLGLSIVYGIIQEHRGNIHVTSKQNEGTEFVITLPAAKR